VLLILLGWFCLRFLVDDTLGKLGQSSVGRFFFIERGLKKLHGLGVP
jgi:hypothetical protein